MARRAMSEPFLERYQACFNHTWRDDESFDRVRFVVLDSETTGLNPAVDRLITIGAVAEAMMLAEAGGASREKFREAIRGGFAESRILELHGARMVTRNFVPGGPSKFQLKDLDAVKAMADLFSLNLPLSEQVRREFSDFVAAGGGDTDHSGLLLHLEAMNAAEGGEGKND